MAPLRVAVDATSLYGPRTGIGRFTEQVLVELAHRPEVDVRAFAVTWRGHEDLTSLVPDGISVVPGRMAAAPLRAVWRRADHPRIERWTGPVDVVHGPNFVVPPAAASRVVSIHDLTFLHHPEFCTADVLQYPGLLRRALASGAWVHTDSDFVRGEVIDLLGADPDRVVTVPLGITPPPSGDPERGAQLARSPRYVLALGTVEPRKNLPGLVRAFDLLASAWPEVTLVIAGPDGWGTDEYRRAVAAAQHRAQIVRLGFVDEADRGALLAGATAVAVPSHYEGFGFSAAEAMAAGVPVVGASRGSLPELVGEAGLLVDPDDEAAIAGALDLLLRDERAAAQLADRGRAQVAALTWSRTADGMVALWQAAFGSRTRRH